MTNAIIYCRFSPRPDHETSTSNERQEERCLAHCYAHGYGYQATFNDRNVSGGTLDRPQLQAAIAALKPGMVLVVDTSDRLARDMLVYLTIQQRVREAGARIEFADGTPPTITAEGELIANIFAAFAQYQRTVIRKKTKAGLARKKDKGVYLGKCPIGYKRDKQGKLMEDADELYAIQKIMRLSKYHPVALVAEVIQREEGDIRGKPWNERTIRRIIERENKRNTLDKPKDAC